jgi:hypothetical protein
MNKNQETTPNPMGNKILVAIVIVVVAVGGFFAGMKYQQSKTQSAAAGGFAYRQGIGQGGAGGFRRFAGQNGQAVRGQIVSTDNGTMTVKLADGSTKIVVLSGNTNITKAASGTKDDLKTGEQVMVFGSNNSDGSVTAQIVQLNPMMRRPSGNPSPATTNQ